MPESITYLCIEPGASPPVTVASPPFRAVVIVEAIVSADWQARVSDWLVQSGCLYMMAWGPNCSSWDDSVDLANLELFGFGEIPDDRFVMTTWHENEPLSEVFWFSKNTASHPTIELDDTLLFHISAINREQEIMQAYDEA